MSQKITIQITFSHEDPYGRITILDGTSCIQSGAKKKKCTWIIGIIVLLILISATLIYDTDINGNGVFAKSATGKFLKGTGLLPYAEKSWYIVVGNLARAFKWSEKLLTVSAKQIFTLSTDFIKILRTAICNVLTILENVMLAEIPIVVKYWEEFLPVLQAVKSTIEDILNEIGTFVEKNMLFGYFSFDSAFKAFNCVVTEYYEEFRNKVDMYAEQ
ncbi:uncharacterized protein LOC119672968 [Teleopsis dalmanni]|uniref:uncharacterized protein LOC119672968 n=1 Tax=Teleopsis dalmanni TaxID=139649 RepID=UPI0018CFBC06|nr:uncharacterized protein LOC119672968 [Teleopsis dalmanni]XP_037940083.1 uncharacterized protein LOC119672968 [Teleopsis dalmanni]